MSVSLQWLLDQSDLDLRLVSGTAADRQVTWAHATDVVDPTPWLAGGELVLTTGPQLPEDLPGQRAYVDRLVAGGIAGLGFGTGLRYDAVPPALVASCSELDLPLLEVPLPTPFIAVAQAVVRRLSEAEVESLQRALTYQQRITRAAVRKGLTGLVGVLSRELRCHAVVLDEYGAAMAASTTDARLLDLVAEHWRRGADDPRGGAVGAETEHGLLEIQRLRGRSAVVGWLAVLHREASEPTDRLLVNQAAGIVTLQLDWPAELIAAYHELGGTLLDLLLDPAQQHLSLAVHLHHFGFERAAPVVLALATAPRAHNRLLKLFTDRLEARARPHVVTRVDGGVAALLVAEDAPDLVAMLDEATREGGPAGVVIGVSGALPQDEVATALAPAREAAQAARRGDQRVGWFDRLALGALLADDAVRERVRSLTVPALAALAGGSNPRDADLLASLDAFLRHNGSWEGAARSLGVHRHTLKARMTRVEEVTGLSLDLAENRVLLHLGLMCRS
ncbi:PucR family transcriptional regulator [Nocardioides guangzhouensis]|uniref:PucR family transcriptional regulator n=1 Tax=Nocardioides guangzhouensis TaxID=2497878 RepID=UPI0014383021|nr:PucR family transcriptional regulator [Nocardioides guangzhouensis]